MIRVEIGGGGGGGGVLVELATIALLPAVNYSLLSRDRLREAQGFRVRV